MSAFANDAQLAELMHLELEPVGIYFGNTEAVCDLDAKPDRRNCVVPFLMTAAKGRSCSMTEETCNCVGGKVGCCFGDGFERGRPTIHKMLSQGYAEGEAPPGMPEHLRVGERFYCDESLGQLWRDALPISERAYPRIVFAPLSKWGEIGTPDLVFAFANPDQISAFIVMLGFHNGRACNTIVPQCAACQSIMYAANEIDSDDPQAVMGLFDVSQRRPILANLLSMTMPYKVWQDMTRDLDKTFFHTHAWAEIAKRLA